MAKLSRSLFFPSIFGLLLCLFFIPLLPTDMEFYPYNLDPPMKLEGALALNGKLNNAERLFENKVKGPESLGVYKNELYTATHGGYIMKLVNNDKELVPVIKIGGKCDGLVDERKCGRPLGVKFDSKGHLYFADAYSGIMRANVTTGETELLIPMTTIIEGKESRLPNSVDVSKDGTIYWTDSSTTNNLDDGLFSALANGSGRLIKFDPRKGTNEVLIDKIHFANGLVLSKDESFIVVAETFKYRLLKYHLKGPKKGTWEVFIDRLPGTPDNLQINEKGHIIASLVAPENEGFSMVRALAPYPTIRRGIAHLMRMYEELFAKIDEWYPNFFSKKAIHWIGHFESISFLYKDRVTIVKLDENGNILETLHATDGKVTGISDFIAFNGYYYLASPFNPYLGRVKIAH